MRTRFRSQSFSQTFSSPIQVRGMLGGSNVSYDINASTVHRYINDEFFVDEPDRSWTLPFGEASRWKREIVPTTSGDVLDGAYDTIAGHPPSSLVYRNAVVHWGAPAAVAGLWTHDYNRELYEPWPYRLRNRVSLNNAIQGLRRRLTSHNGDLAETIGELPECKQLFKLVSRYRGLKSNAAGLYLGYRFGWKPTVDAFVASCQELQRWTNALDEIHRRRDGTLTLVYRADDPYSLARVSKQKVLAYARPYNESTGDRGSVTTEYEDPVVESHKGTIAYMARINSVGRYVEGWDTMSRLARIGAIPSLETLWALLPNSFLVDWFVSVGDMISYMQGNLLYDQELLCEAWSWSLKDHLNVYRRGRQSYVLCSHKVDGFYRSRRFPLGVSAFPRLGLVSNRVLPTLAVLLASRLPGDTANVRTLYRTLKRLGYAW